RAWAGGGGGGGGGEGGGRGAGGDGAGGGPGGGGGPAVPEDRAVPGPRAAKKGARGAHRHSPLRGGRGDLGSGPAGFQHHVHACLVAEQPPGAPAAEHRGHRRAAARIVVPHAPDVPLEVAAGDQAEQRVLGRAGRVLTQRAG